MCPICTFIPMHLENILHLDEIQFFLQSMIARGLKEITIYFNYSNTRCYNY